MKAIKLSSLLVGFCLLVAAVLLIVLLVAPIAEACHIGLCGSVDCEAGKINIVNESGHDTNVWGYVEARLGSQTGPVVQTVTIPTTFVKKGNTFVFSFSWKPALTCGKYYFKAFVQETGGLTAKKWYEPKDCTCPKLLISHISCVEVGYCEDGLIEVHFVVNHLPGTVGDYGQVDYQLQTPAGTVNWTANFDKRSGDVAHYVDQFKSPDGTYKVLSAQVTIDGKTYLLSNPGKTYEVICSECPPSCDLLTLTPTSGYAPLAVHAKVDGTNAQSAEIDWGEGSGWEALVNFEGDHTYAQAGTYKVKARVLGNDGKYYESGPCKGEVKVSLPQRPHCLDLTGQPVTGTVPYPFKLIEVEFNDPDNQVVGWEIKSWDDRVDGVLASPVGWSRLVDRVGTFEVMAGMITKDYGIVYDDACRTQTTATLPPIATPTPEPPPPPPTTLQLRLKGDNLGDVYEDIQHGNTFGEFSVVSLGDIKAYYLGQVPQMIFHEGNSEALMELRLVEITAHDAREDRTKSSSAWVVDGVYELGRRYIDLNAEKMILEFNTGGSPKLLVFQMGEHLDFSQVVPIPPSPDPDNPSDSDKGGKCDINITRYEGGLWVWFEDPQMDQPEDEARWREAQDAAETLTRELARRGFVVVNNDIKKYLALRDEVGLWADPELVADGYEIWAAGPTSEHEFAFNAEFHHKYRVDASYGDDTGSWETLGEIIGGKAIGSINYDGKVYAPAGYQHYRVIRTTLALGPWAEQALWTLFGQEIHYIPDDVPAWIEIGPDGIVTDTRTAEEIRRGLDTLPAPDGRFRGNWQSPSSSSESPEPETEVLVEPSVAVAQTDVVTYTVTVQAGDTLWDLATEHLGGGGNWGRIAKASGLTNTLIHVGQILVIPVANAAAEIGLDPATVPVIPWTFGLLSVFWGVGAATVVGKKTIAAVFEVQDSRQKYLLLALAVIAFIPSGISAILAFFQPML